MGRIGIELTGWRTILAPAALQRSPIHVVARKLTNRHSRIFVSVHLDKCKSPISLETGFNNVTEILEQRDQIVLGGVRG